MIDDQKNRSGSKNAHALISLKRVKASRSNKIEWELILCLKDEDKLVELLILTEKV